MVFRHGFFHGDPHPANIFVLESGELGLVDFGQAGKLTDDDMAKLTRLFVDAATENVDALPRRLRELGVRYAPEREQEFRAELRVLFDRYYGTRLSDIDPLQVIREAFQLIYSLNLRAAEPVRDARQGDRDARVGRAGGVSGLQRLRGREAVRARAARGPVPPARVVSQRARVEALALGSIAREMPYQVSDILEQPTGGNVPGSDREPRHRRARRTTSTRRRTGSQSRSSSSAG